MKLKSFMEEGFVTNTPNPLTFTLTASTLNFLAVFFDTHPFFYQYVFTDKLMLFYIRTHWISFI